MICPTCAHELRANGQCPMDDGSFGYNPARGFKFDRPIPKPKITKEDKPAIMLVEHVARHLKITQDEVGEIFRLVPDTNGKSHVLREDYEKFRVDHQSL